MIGKTLGHYEILEPLGKGGMGEVYRARDTKLQREVAVKVLRADLADDPDRLARLQREAQLLAQLEHPNIAAIYGIEEHAADNGKDVRFLVMQLADGDTLAKILRTGTGSAGSAGGGTSLAATATGLPMSATLRIAEQIADALEAAHDKGIVHRDLKPANVMVAFVDGEPVVKVLDFGLAKAFQPDGSAADVSPDLSASPTVMAATGTGMIMGTAGYMSPEQARGQRVDKRADVWAFGVVLYEMLAGRRLFRGDTVSDTLAAVLKDSPDFDALPAGTPAAIRRLLRRCLARAPRRRLRDIADARLEIEEASATGPDAEDVVGGHAHGPGPGRRSLSSAHVVGAIALVAVTALLTWGLVDPVPESPAPRQFLVGPEEATEAMISPDGTKVVVWIGQTAFVRDLGSLELQPLDLGPSRFIRDVAWSPDSSQVAFYRGGRIVIMNADGSAARELGFDFDGIFEGRGIDWGPAGVLVPDLDRGLVLVPTDGGEIGQVARQDEGILRGASFLPDGRTIAYIIGDFRSGVFNFGKLIVQRGLDVGAERVVVVDDPGEVWERVFYAEEAEVLLALSVGANPGIWAFPLSRTTYEPSGPGYRLFPEAGEASISEDGTLVYTSGTARLAHDPFVWVDRGGRIIDTIETPRRESRWPSLSPDGTKVVFRAADVLGAAYDMWVLDLVNGSETRITSAPGTAIQGDWLDNERVIYAAGQFGFRTREAVSTVAVQLASGLGAAEATGESGEIRTPNASRDGRFIAYARRADETGWDIHYQSLESGEHRVYLSSPGDERLPILSPDGRLIAYVSDASGSAELWVSSFPEPSSPQRLSLAGAGYVRWSPKGDEIFFDDGGGVLWAVAVDMNAEHGPDAYGPPIRLFAQTDAGGRFNHFGTRGWDVGPDGERFLLVQRFDTSVRQTPIVIQNFAAWLDQR